MTTIDTSSSEYQLTLKLANIILTHNERDQITDLLEFKDIERQMFLKSDINTAFHQIKDDFYGCFNKSKTGYYRNESKSWSFVAFKNAIKQLGFVLDVEKRTSYKVIDTRKAFFVGYHYTVIIKK